MGWHGLQAVLVGSLGREDRQVELHPGFGLRSVLNDIVRPIAHGTTVSARSRLPLCLMEIGV